MKPEQLEDLLCYRMEQAHETLREAEILLKESALRGTINRAHLDNVKLRVEAQPRWAVMGGKTANTIGLLPNFEMVGSPWREPNIVKVKTGVFPRELSRSLRLAFDRRQTHDYGEMIPVNRQIAKRTLTDAKTFVAAIESHLRSVGHLAAAQEGDE